MTSRDQCRTGPMDTGGSITGFEGDDGGLPPRGLYPTFRTDRYRVIELLQRGGMGNVYRAEDLMLNREVAIKVLRNDRATKPTAEAEFFREAQTLSSLSHPGVTPIYEVGSCENGLPFYVMTLIDGTTFHEMLHSQLVGIAGAIQIFANVCQTMAFAHSRGVIHLDLKPANVMVGSFGEVNVMDWGLAQNLPTPEPAEDVVSEPGAPAYATRTIQQQQINGTPEYMSPEQAGGGALDKRSDVFSLGGILCKVLTGHAPYEAKSLRRVYRKAVNGQISDAVKRLRNTRFHPSLVRLAIQCLDVDPRRRPPDAASVCEALTRHRKSTLDRLEGDMYQFFELCSDMFCIADHNGFFLRVNANFNKVLGYSEEELLSQPFLNFVLEQDRPQTIEQVSLLRRGKPVVRFQNRYRTAGGDYTTLEWTAKTIEGEELVFAVARQVTSSLAH